MKFFSKKLVLIGCVSFGCLVLFSFLFSSCGRNLDLRNNNNNGNFSTPDPDSATTTASRPRTSSSSSSSRYCEGSGGGRCIGDSDCEEMCEDLFSGRDEDQCKELNVNAVQDLHNTFDNSDGLLADPDYDARNSSDELSNVCIEAITTALIIDEDYWYDIYKDYSNSEARDVLLWFVQEPEIYGAIDEGIREANDRNDRDDVEDEVKRLLNTLLSKAGGGDVIDGLKAGLDSEEDNIEDNTFFVYAVDSVSDTVLEWTYELAEDDCRQHGGNPECLLRELFCARQGNTYLFEDESIFESFLDHVEDLENCLEDVSGLDEDDLTDAETVCPRVARYSTLPSECR